MPTLLLSDTRGTISIHPHLEAAGMSGGSFFKLDGWELIRLPPGSRLFMLPHRMPVAYDAAAGGFVTLKGSCAVAAFIAPGYTVTHTAAYRELGRPKMLPLFSYAAVCLHKGEPHVTAIQVDKDARHDCRFIDIDTVRKNVKIFRKTFGPNRLIGHLEACALVHGCPNAQNFFLSRYEGPLPTSPSCNASCSGCISYQPGKRCPVAQPRITFVPTPEEVAGIALFHIRHVNKAIVSFGQGCDGEPLLQDTLLEKAITIIRNQTRRGVININTNGSRPESLSRLFDLGLDSCRISMNSAREKYYKKYYKPRGYTFSDVLRSIRIARKRGSVSINYLTMPGFTDSGEEFEAFKLLLRTYDVDMIQWRNLNYDPVRYFEEMGIKTDGEEVIGIRKEMALLKRQFPRLKMGYFNPLTPRAAVSPRPQRHG